MGLVGDHIRAHRYDIAIRIVERAKKLCGDFDVPISAPPLKFLIPFLEKSSAENSDHAIMEMWAQLLASSSKNFRGTHLTFIQILSEISSDEAKFLNEIRDEYDPGDYPFAWDTTNYSFEMEQYAEKVSKYINARFSLGTRLTTSGLANQLIDDLEKHKLHLQCKPTAYTVPFVDIKSELSRLSMDMDRSVTVLLLQRQGLMTVKDVHFSTNIGEFNVELGLVTSLGKMFLDACVGRGDQ